MDLLEGVENQEGFSLPSRSVLERELVVFTLSRLEIC